MKDYVNLTFQNFLIPVINKSTRVTKTNATLIDHIQTNDFVNTDSSTGIVNIELIVLCEISLKFSLVS